MKHGKGSRPSGNVSLCVLEPTVKVIRFQDSKNVWGFVPKTQIIS